MKLTDLPEINFVEVDVEEMLSESKALVEEIVNRKLAEADPLTLFLKSLIAVIAQQNLLINEMALQNLLAKATGANLEHIGALYGLERLSAAAAKTTCEVRLSAGRATSTVINAGTRINAGDEINFALDNDAIFLAGETTATVGATCLSEGTIGNGYAVGELNRIVDNQPFLLSIKNVTETEGGADTESDEDFRERIHQAPESFSVAGPAGAYEYFAKKTSTLISDVYVDSPEPGVVEVYVLMENGELPDVEMINAVYENINADSVRPLTDLVRVKAAAVINYDVAVRFWINRSKATQAAQIKKAAESAVEGYVKWQKAALGRDIDSSELYYRMRAAGADRIEISAPEFIATPPYSVAIADNISVEYKGLKDD